MVAGKRFQLAQLAQLAQSVQVVQVVQVVQIDVFVARLFPPLPKSLSTFPSPPHMGEKRLNANFY